MNVGGQDGMTTYAMWEKLDAAEERMRAEALKRVKVTGPVPSLYYATPAQLRTHELRTRLRRKDG